jgi:hypothetical protein
MRKTLGVFMNGAPMMEGFFHVVAALRANDRVNLRIYVPSGYLRREPRARAVFAQAGLRPIVVPNVLLKQFHSWWFRGLDATIAISDPITDRTTYRHRHRAAVAQGLPIIFVQHSAVQGGLNFPMPLYDAKEYASSLILTYTPMDHMAYHFTPDTMAKMRTVGFLKKYPLPLHQPTGELAEILSRFEKRVVLCHSFRWAFERFDTSEHTRFFEMVEQSAKENPDILYILRPHRGKSGGEIQQQQDFLTRNPNIIVSNTDRGPLAGLSLYDIVGFSDALVSHASTAVLDGLYGGIPAAILAETSGDVWFPTLPRVSDAQSLSAFLNSARIDDPVYQDLIEEFGQFDENIQRASRAIEDYLEAL